MPKPIKIADATAPGNPPEKKDNEDRLAHTSGADSFFALVCDGDSQLCDEQGMYPREHGANAAEIIKQHLYAKFTWHRATVDLTKHALMEANKYVQLYNKGAGQWDIKDWRYYDRSATTVVCAFAERQSDGSLHGHVLSLGDSLAFHFSPNKPVVMLTRDQLQPAIIEGAKKGWGEMSPAWTVWSRSTVRNNRTLQGDAGNPLGYGAIDGNPDFVHFIEVQPFTLQPGDALLLASDALRALSTSDDPDDAAGYQYLSRDVTGMPLDSLPEYLIKKTRQAEATKGIRVDDATVVVIRN